jgi:diguanylate cyclase (GGDEF)-like protein
MPASIAKTHSEPKIIGAVLLVLAMLLSAVAALLVVSKNELYRGLQQINTAQLTELARQIALTLDASLDPAALTDPHKMQAVVERNMASRKLHAMDNLLLEIRIHAPDPSSSVGYRAVAASAPQLIGQESDPEDIEAIRKGELVVLSETRNGVSILDITCPLHLQGAVFGTAGIKLSMQQGFSLIEAISLATIRTLKATAALTVLLTGLISLAMIVVLLRDNAIRKQLLKNLQEQATTDELTGLINRRKCMEIANSELKRALRFDHPLTVALLDVDRFKQINDRYGHAAGDKALVVVAAILQQTVRETDIAARLGGDEFILLLPETDSVSAHEVLERYRKALENQSIELDGNAISITVSIGIASLKKYNSTGDHEQLKTLIERADQALYQAKNSGRNKVCVEEPNNPAAA